MKIYFLQKNLSRKILLIFLMITFLGTLATISLFPLFSDEIQIRLWLSRLPYEFPERITGVGRCFSAFLHPIPIVFYTSALINWVLHGLIESPTFLRVISILILLFWLSLLVGYLHFNLKNRKIYNNNHIVNAIAILSIFFIGINPIFIGINRNEQLYYPSFIILIIITIYCHNFKELKFRIISLSLILIFINLILYGHPKGLFFVPFFLVICWQISNCFKSPKKIFFLLFVLIIYISIESHRTWSNSYKCPEIPEFEAFMKTFYFDPLSIFYNPIEFTNKAWQSLIRFIEYPVHFEFKKQYIWNFLPDTRNFNSIHKILNWIIKFLVSTIYISTLIFTLFFTLKNKKNRNVNFILLSLLMCTTIWAIFNLTKNIYDASFLYTITSIVFIFLVIENNLINIKSKLLRVFLLITLTISVLSQVTFIANNLFPFIRGFTGPGIKIGLYESQRVHNSIRDASQACEIHPTNGKYIVIDDLTYGFFRKSHGPISFTYNRVGTTKTPLQDLFRTVDSDGMILDCNNMPEKFREKSTRANNICCLSKSDIKKYFLDINNSELN